MIPRARDVVRIFDLYTSPREPKLHICVSERRQLFLRINSQSIFKPNHLLRKSTNAYLAHDSYVELQQLVRHMSEEIREAEFVGRLSLAEAKALVDAAHGAETLPMEHKRLIAECLLDGQ
ncbi:MAG TPA: hypothetical protein VGX95_17185 [Xanthobacteraceae bacterium]|jgi:hypothetical protein|nr:hypothetical protein [Xanthobacteraceae bacterium]